MHFGTKNYLKSNHNHTAKQILNAVRKLKVLSSFMCCPKGLVGRRKLKLPVGFCSETSKPGPAGRPETRSTRGWNRAGLKKK